MTILKSIVVLREHMLKKIEESNIKTAGKANETTLS